MRPPASWHIKRVQNAQFYAPTKASKKESGCSRHYCFGCLFCCFTSQVNSYGHGGTVSSTNHTFSSASLNKQLTSTSCTHFHLLNDSAEGRSFMINLHESMKPDRNRTRDPWICNRDPWICSQIRICSQTRY